MALKDVIAKKVAEYRKYSLNHPNAKLVESFYRDADEIIAAVLEHEDTLGQDTATLEARVSDLNLEVNTLQDTIGALQADQEKLVEAAAEQDQKLEVQIGVTKTLDADALRLADERDALKGKLEAVTAERDEAKAKLSRKAPAKK
ncbi:MAG: hypothetical protein JKY34_08730 [Kordiimonadaceae bacterium]|nr:hypothetical protein [Kordiimonadaceae bacterium]